MVQPTGQSTLKKPSYLMVLAKMKGLQNKVDGLYKRILQSTGFVEKYRKEGTIKSLVSNDETDTTTFEAPSFDARMNCQDKCDEMGFKCINEYDNDATLMLVTDICGSLCR